MSFKPLLTHEITASFQDEMNHISHLFCPLSLHRSIILKWKEISFLITEQHRNKLIWLLKLSTVKYYYLYNNLPFIYYSRDYWSFFYSKSIYITVQANCIYTNHRKGILELIILKKIISAMIDHFSQDE